MGVENKRRCEQRGRTEYFICASPSRYEGWQHNWQSGQASSFIGTPVRCVDTGRLGWLVVFPERQVLKDQDKLMDLVGDEAVGVAERVER